MEMIGCCYGDNGVAMEIMGCCYGDMMMMRCPYGGWSLIEAPSN